MKNSIKITMFAAALALASCHHIDERKPIGNDEKDCPVTVDNTSVEESELTMEVDDFLTKVSSKNYMEAAKLYDGGEKDFRAFYKKKINKSPSVEWKWQVEYCEINEEESARTRVNITIFSENDDDNDIVRRADLYWRYKDENWKLFDLVFF